MAFSQACLDLATKAASSILSREEVLSAFQRVEDYRNSLIADGNTAGSAENLRRFGAEEAERTRMAAALERRRTAINTLVKADLQEHLATLTAGGLRPRDALLALHEGTQHGIEEGRVSIAAHNSAFRRRYNGAMMSEMQRDNPHLLHLMDDQSLDNDVTREMMQLRDGGKPGITGNKDAQYMAKMFSKYGELARTDANALGGDIGKMEGYAGPQTHDPALMIAPGKNAKDQWVGYVLPKLDLRRTFPEGLTSDQAVKVLGDVYDTIITGLPNTPTASENGEFSGPGRITKSLEASRVLHFKDADSAMAYRDVYGYSNTMQGMMSHLNRMARVNANMTMLGTNPEMMFSAIAKDQERSIKNATEVPAGVRYGVPGRRYAPTLEQWKNHESNLIDTQHGVLRHALDISTGAAGTPGNPTFAKIGANIRAGQTAAKIGASLPSLITDVPISAASAQFRGSSFFGGLVNQMSGILGQHNTQDEKEIAYMLRESFEGIGNSVNSPFAGTGDHLTGWTSKMMVQFLKWSGHSWWTNASRDTAGQTLSAEMGMRSGTAYADLPKQYRRVLGMNGIDEPRWDIIRQSGLRAANGRNYITPDRILEMPDEAFAPLVQDRLDAAGDDPDKRAAIFEGGRRDVQLSMLRFIGDEMRHSVMTTDARAQRWLTQGTRPGTLGGEALRFATQFKSFPMAFMSGVGGRALHGFAPEDRLGLNPQTWVGEQGKHIGSLLAGMTMAGYMAMTMKDVLKGYWPPRDPTDPRTMMAAFQQGGGLGIYGDFLFGGANRYGGNALETLAGPTFGTAAQLVGDAQGIRDYYSSGGVTPSGQPKTFPLTNLFSNVVSQTPFANLHMLKPALDYLFLNSIREAISPGYLRREAKMRQQEYGQTSIWPQTASPNLAGNIRNVMGWHGR